MPDIFTALARTSESSCPPHAPGSPRLSLLPARRRGKPRAASSLIRISNVLRHRRSSIHSEETQNRFSQLTTV
jgi:hypothetical protein